MDFFTILKIIIVIIYIIPPIVFYCFGWTQLNVLWITIGGVVVFKLFGIIDKNYKDKLQHSQKLIRDAFEQQVYNGTVRYYEGEDDNPIVSTPLYWIGINNDEVIQHLKNIKYKELCEAYAQAKRYVEIITPDIEKKLQQYRDTVKQRLTEANIPLKPSNKYIGETEYYNNAALKNEIYNEVKGEDVLYKNKYLPLQIRNDSPPLRLWYGNVLIAIGALPSLEYLKGIIDNIRRDEVIQRVVLDIEAEKLKLENNTALESFKREIKKIIKHVSKENVLDGSCDNRNCSFH